MTTALGCYLPLHFRFLAAVNRRFSGHWFKKLTTLCGEHLACRCHQLALSSGLLHKLI